MLLHPKLHVAKAMEITAGESLLGLHMQNKLSCTPGVHEACMLPTQVDFNLNNVTVSPFLTPRGSILSMLCLLYLQHSESAHLQHQRCQTRTALNDEAKHANPSGAALSNIYFPCHQLRLSLQMRKLECMCME